MAQPNVVLMHRPSSPRDITILPLHPSRGGASPLEWEWGANGVEMHLVPPAPTPALSPVDFNGPFMPPTQQTQPTQFTNSGIRVVQLKPTDHESSRNVNINAPTAPWPAGSGTPVETAAHRLDGLHADGLPTSEMRRRRAEPVDPGYHHRFRKEMRAIHDPSSIPAANSIEGQRLIQAMKKRRNIGMDYEDVSRDRNYSQLSLATIALSWGGILMLCITQLVFADPHGNMGESKVASLVLQFLISLSTALCILLIISYYYAVGSDLARARRAAGLPKGRPWWQSRRGIYCLVEVVVHIPHPVPYVHYHTSVLAVVMFARLYLVCRIAKFFSDAFMERFSIFDNARTSFGKYLVNVDSAMCMRVLFYRRAGWFFVGFTALTIIPLAATVMIAERDENEGFDKYSNCIWYVFITFTTVGYGDFYPVSWLGRLCGVFAALAGLVGANLFAAMLTNSLAPTPAQDCIMEYLNLTRARKNYDEARLRYVQMLVRKWYIRRHPHRTTANEALAQFKESHVVKRLHRMRRQRALVQQHPDKPQQNNDKLESAVQEVAHQCKDLQKKIILITQNTIQKQQDNTQQKRAKEAAKEAEKQRILIEKMELKKDREQSHEVLIKKIEDVAKIALTANNGTCSGSIEAFKRWTDSQDQRRLNHEDKMESKRRQFEESMEQRRRQQEAEIHHRLDTVQRQQADQFATQQALMAQQQEALNVLRQQQSSQQQHLDRLQTQLVSFVDIHGETAARATAHRSEGVAELRTRVDTTMDHLSNLKLAVDHQNAATAKLSHDLQAGLKPLQTGLAAANDNINHVKHQSELAHKELKAVEEKVESMAPLANTVKTTKAEVAKLVKVSSEQQTGFEDVRRKLATVVMAIREQKAWNNHIVRHEGDHEGPGHAPTAERTERPHAETSLRSASRERLPRSSSNNNQP